MNNKERKRLEKNAARSRLRYFCDQTSTDLFGKFTDQDLAAIDEAGRRLQKELDRKINWSKSRALSASAKQLTPAEIKKKEQEVLTLQKLKDKSYSEDDKKLIIQLTEEIKKLREKDEKLIIQMEKSRQVLAEKPELRADPQIARRLWEENIAPIVAEAGRIGARVRAQKLTAEERREIASKAAKARWQKN